MYLLSRLWRAKAAVGLDIVVAKMLHALPWDALLLIHEAFVHRYIGRYAEFVRIWKVVEIILIAKVRRADILKKHKGIGLRL